jgi:hypothetical protein
MHLVLLRNAQPVLRLTVSRILSISLSAVYQWPVVIFSLVYPHWVIVCLCIKLQQYVVVDLIDYVVLSKGEGVETVSCCGGFSAFSFFGSWQCWCSTFIFVYVASVEMSVLLLNEIW